MLQSETHEILARVILHIFKVSPFSVPIHLNPEDRLFFLDYKLNLLYPFPNTKFHFLLLSLPFNFLLKQRISLCSE